MKVSFMMIYHLFNLNLNFSFNYPSYLILDYFSNQHSISYSQKYSLFWVVTKFYSSKSWKSVQLSLNKLFNFYLGRPFNFYQSKLEKPKCFLFMNIFPIQLDSS